MKNRWHHAFSIENMTDFIIQQIAEDIEPQELISHINSVDRIVFSPDGSTFISGSLYNKDKTCSNLFMWDTKTGKRLLKLKVNPEYIGSFSFSPNGRQILTTCSSDQNNLATWDAYTGAMIFSFIPDDCPASFAMFTPDGKKIISADSSCRKSDINVWNPHTGKKTFNIHHNEWNGCTKGRAILSPNGMRITVFCSEEKCRHITILDTNTGMLLCKINNFTHNIRALIFSPDNTKIAFFNNNENSTIYTWDVQTGEKLVTIECHSHLSKSEYNSFDIRSIQFSPNGKYIASTSNQKWNNFIVWDAHTGEKVFDLIGHHNPINEVIFTSDNNSIISSSYDEEIGIIVWDIHTGKKLFNLINHPRSVWSAALSPDGSTLVAGGYGNENNLFIWRIPFNLITTIKKKLNEKQIQFLYNHYRSFEDKINYTITPDNPDYEMYLSLPDLVKKAIHHKPINSMLRRLEKWITSNAFRLEIIINKTWEEQRLNCRRKILLLHRKINHLLYRRKSKLEFLKLVRCTPPYTGYSYKDASNIEMSILDCFIAHDCYSTTSAKEWALNDAWESGGGNITWWEKEDGYILITDVYSEEELPTVLKIKIEQFIKLLDDWEEKVVKLNPKEITITYQYDEYIIKTKD